MAAVTVNVDWDVLDPGVMVAGDREQVMPAGWEQDKEIGPLNPPAALAPTVRVAAWPGATVALCAERVSEKSALVTVDAGTSVANKPVVCELPPAVKYRVFGSPVPPAPKTMSHKPGLTITLFPESVN